MDVISLTRTLNSIPNTALSEVLQLLGLNLPPPITPAVAAQALINKGVAPSSLIEALEAVHMNVAAGKVKDAVASSTRPTVDGAASSQPTTYTSSSSSSSPTPILLSSINFSPQLAAIDKRQSPDPENIQRALKMLLRSNVSARFCKDLMTAVEYIVDQRAETTLEDFAQCFELISGCSALSRDLISLSNTSQPSVTPNRDSASSSSSSTAAAKDEDAFRRRMEIISSQLAETPWSYSSSGPSSSSNPSPLHEVDLSLLEAHSRRVIADSAAVISTFDTSSRPNVTWFNVPNLNHDFIGRFDELRQLSQSLLGQAQVMTITHPLLVGMGGIGKSELAILFAHHSRPYFRDHIRLIHAEDTNSLANSFRDFARHLKLSVEPQHSTEEVVQMVYTHLSRLEQCLLIFDGVMDPDTIYPFICPQFIRGNKKHRMLITSRSHQWLDLSEHCGIKADREKIELPLWNTVEAVAYVLNRLDGAAPVADVLGLVSKLDHLPLAITLAVAYIKNEDLSIARYMTIFDELELSPSSLLEVDRKADPAYRPDRSSHTKNIASTFSLTRQALATQHREKVRQGDSSIGDALVIVHLMALIQPREIPDHMFQHLFTEHGEHRAKRALNCLVRYSLIQKDTSYKGICAGQQMYSMHVLVQAAIRRSLFPQEESAWANRSLILISAEEISNALASESTSTVTMSSCIFLLCTMLTAPLVYQRDQMADRAVQRGVYPHACHFLAKHAVDELLFDGCYLVWGNVAAALGNAGDAARLLTKAVHIQKQFYGSEHIEVARTLNNLGSAHGSLGDHEIMKQMLERALQIKEKYHGSEHIEVAMTLGNLGSTYGILGDHKTAKQMLERALRTQEGHYGSEHIEVSGTLNCLACAHGDLGDHKTMKRMLKRALQIQKQHYGDEHIEVALMLGNLGSAHGHLGDHKTKKKLLKRALRIQEGHYGSEHIDVTGTLNNLGSAYGDLGDHETAKQILERVLRIQEGYYRSEHIDMAGTLNNLGRAHGLLGDHKTKKQILERALGILDQTRSYDPQLRKLIINDLIFAYLKLGDVFAANQLARVQAPSSSLPSSSPSSPSFDGISFAGIFKDKLPALLKKYHCSDKQQVLRRAATAGQLNDVKILVQECGAEINKPDDNPASRRSALHLAYRNQRTAVVEWLLAHGADGQIQDADGLIPAASSPAVAASSSSNFSTPSLGN